MSIAVKELKEAKVALFANGGYVDTAPGEEYANLRAALLARGHKVKDFTDASATGLESALDGRKVLVIPELELGAFPLSAESIAVIRDFVARGGTLIIGGSSSGNDTNFLNGVFGFALIATGASEPIERQDAADGTTFADAPDLLAKNLDTNALFTASLPNHALNLYGDAIDSVVTAFGYGNGQIVYLGWDWDDGAPDGSQTGGWLNVLKSAVSKGDGRVIGTNAGESFDDTHAPPGQSWMSNADERVFGKGGDDYISGFGGDDELHGGKGDDNLAGYDGNDRLFGDAGDDYLSDQSGSNKLWGGKGDDTFAFSSPTLADAPTIKDFTSGEDILFLDCERVRRARRRYPPRLGVSQGIARLDG